MLLPLFKEAEQVAQLNRSSLRNRLLRAMSADDFALLEPHLESVTLELRQNLLDVGTHIGNVTFVEHGTVSLLASTEEGRFEIGMTGYEGLVGVPALLAVETSPHSAMVQASGSAMRLSTQRLQAAMERSRPLQILLLRYVHTFVVQVSQTAYANAGYSIEARLARWILMTDDRLDRPELPLTHDFLAMMLGTRRPGVTFAVQALEGNGLIKATRGRIVVRNRPGLEELAGDAYGLAEREYAALIPSVS